MISKFSLSIIQKNSLEERIGKFKNLLEQIYNENKKIILFGSGAVGQEKLEIIRKLSRCSVVFCDNNPVKQGTFINGVKVISFNELLLSYKESYIVIASLTYYEEIKKQLIKHGLYNKIIDAFGRFDTELYYYLLVEQYENEFAKVYDLLADESSKKVFIDRINYCITGNSKYLENIKSDCSQYFENNVLCLDENEIFVDGGGFTGDTVEEFLKQTSGRFGKIYSFEPEESKHSIFKQKFCNYENIELIPYGLWSKKDTLKFEAKDNGGSKIGNTGNIEIKVLSIDEFFNEEKTTFIKMDIEGAELEALKGAKNTIEQYKPKLAICVYHRPLDIIEIPLYLSSIEPSYRFYFRHYSTLHTETVLYAVSE